MATSVSCGYCLYQDGMQMTALLQRQYDAGPSFTDAGTAAALAPLGGVIPGPGANLKVTAPASGLTVNVAAGYAVVPSFTSGQGSYYFGLMTSASLTVAANTTGSTRQDYVIAYVNDLGTSASAASIAYLAGTAAPPALPASSIILALVSVPNGASGIVAGDITDERTFCVAPGGILPLPDASDAPAGPPSQLFWDIATQTLLQATTGAPVAYQPNAAVTTLEEQLIVTAHTTGTWVCPAGVYAVRVQAWGAGGAGGDGESGSGPGAGGGGGEYAEEPAYAVVPGTSYPYVVPGRPGDQGNGGNTTFATSGVIAHGGQAGTSGEFTSGGGAGGAGGSGSTNTIHYPGGAGGSPANGSSAGGSSAGPGSAGNTGADGTDAATAATAAVSGGGPGAAGVASGDEGRAPSSGPGGGGSGASAFSDGQGGAGWQGQLILTWDEPADSPGFAYQPAGTLWQQGFGNRALAQVSFTADGLSDWEFSYHAAQVAAEDSGASVEMQLWIDGQQADMIRVDGTSIGYPYETMPAQAVSADATWFTSASQGTRPAAGTHTAQIKLSASGNEVVVASPWWLRAGAAGSS